MNAEELGQRLGHEVKGFTSASALCGSGVEALAVASPSEHHLEALQAAAEAHLPTLCEKPLVHEHHIEEGARIIESFAQERLPLLENCQWPYVLAAFFQLHGQPKFEKQAVVEMGLGPPRRGREMVQNMLSHLLSVIQAIGVADPDAIATDVHLDDPAFERTRNVLRFRLAGPGRTVEGAFYLEIREAPPRPAWLAIDGLRMDRQVGEGHSIAFSANGKEVTIDDPMQELVARFAAMVRDRDPVVVDSQRELVRQRLQWYRQILRQLP